MPTGTSNFATELSPVVPTAESVRALADAINARPQGHPVRGAGVRGAHAEVMRLAETVHAPIGHTLRGKEWIQFDNPYDVGMSGLLGYGACYEAMHEAELMIMLGTDFPYDTFLPAAHTIQIDHDAARLGRRTPLQLAVHGDVGDDARARCSRWSRRRPTATSWTGCSASTCGHWKAWSARTPSDVEQHLPIHPEYVADILDELAADDAVFTVDTGMCNVWAARYLTPNGRRRVIGSFLHGTMANALPHAIGAQFAHPAGRWCPCPATAASACCSASCSPSSCTSCPSRSWCSTTPRWAW